MAVFYKGIKGLNESIYSYIKWNEYSKDTHDKSSISNPMLWIGDSDNVNLNNIDNTNCLYAGNILTSHVCNCLYGDGTNFVKFYNSNDEDFFSISADLFAGKVIIQANSFQVQSYVNFLNPVYMADLEVADAVMIDNNLFQCLIPSNFTQPINCTSSINALYFNVRSDKRAKENIRPIETKALDIVNKIPVCSFEYKDNKMPSIGIIAQDLQDIDIDNFSFVVNKEATGEKEDYMGIAESKLVYILWKAIQEQQQEIEFLKNKLEDK